MEGQTEGRLLVGPLKNHEERNYIQTYILHKVSGIEKNVLEVGKSLSFEHPEWSVFIIVLHGTLRLHILGQTLVLKENWYAYIPNGICYTLKNDGPAISDYTFQCGKQVDSTAFQRSYTGIASFINSVHQRPLVIGNRTNNRSPLSPVNVPKETVIRSSTVNMIVEDADDVAVMTALWSLTYQENSMLTELLEERVNQELEAYGIFQNNENIPRAFDLFRRGSNFWPLFYSELPPRWKGYLLVLANMYTQFEELRLGIPPEYLIEEAQQMVYRANELLGIQIRFRSEIELSVSFFMIGADHTRWTALVSRFERGIANVKKRNAGRLPNDPRVLIVDAPNPTFFQFRVQNRVSPFITDEHIEYAVKHLSEFTAHKIGRLMFEQDENAYRETLNELKRIVGSN